MATNALQIKTVFKGVDAVSPVLRQIAKSARGTLGGIARAATSVQGLLLGGGLIIGAKKAVDAFVGITDSLDAMDESAQKVSLTAEALGGLRYAASFAGVGAEQLDGSLKKLSKSMVGVRDGTGSWFEKLKAGNPALLKQLQGTKDNEEAFLLLMGAMEQAGESDQTTLALDAFGKSGQDLIPVAKQGREAIKKLAAEFRATHPDLNEATKLSSNFQDSLGRLKNMASGLGETVVSKLLPVITPLIDQLTAWVGKNRELISQKIVEVVQAIGKAISEIPWADIKNTISSVWDTVGGLSGAFKALGAVIAVGFVANLAQAAAAIAANPLLASLVAMGAAVAYLTLQLSELNGLTQTVDDTMGTVQEAKDRHVRHQSAADHLAASTPSNAYEALQRLNLGSRGFYRGGNPDIAQMGEPAESKIVVRFDGLPAGMSVSAVKSRTPGTTVTADTGLRTSVGN